MINLRGGGGGGGITSGKKKFEIYLEKNKLLLITVVGTDFGREGGFSRIITGEGVRGGGGR